MPDNFMRIADVMAFPQLTWLASSAARCGPSMTRIARNYMLRFAICWRAPARRHTS